MIIGFSLRYDVTKAEPMPFTVKPSGTVIIGQPDPSGEDRLKVLLKGDLDGAAFYFSKPGSRYVFDPELEAPALVAASAEVAEEAWRILESTPGDYPMSDDEEWHAGHNSFMEYYESQTTTLDRVDWLAQKLRSNLCLAQGPQIHEHLRACFNRLVDGDVKYRIPLDKSGRSWRSLAPVEQIIPSDRNRMFGL
jgi:hypothetical protein